MKRLYDDVIEESSDEINTTYFKMMTFSSNVFHLKELGIQIPGKFYFLIFFVLPNHSGSSCDVVLLLILRGGGERWQCWDLGGGDIGARVAGLSCQPSGGSDLSGNYAASESCRAQSLPFDGG